MVILEGVEQKHMMYSLILAFLFFLTKELANLSR